MPNECVQGWCVHSIRPLAETVLARPVFVTPKGQISGVGLFKRSRKQQNLIFNVCADNGSNLIVVNRINTPGFLPNNPFRAFCSFPSAHVKMEVVNRTGPDRPLNQRFFPSKRL